MPEYLGPAVLAFFIAAGVTWLELVTSKYPRTIPFLLRSWLLYIYGVIYGAIAAGVTLAFPALAASGALQLGGVANNPWLQAAAVGVAVKAVLHIRLFTVQSVPIGLETLVLLFEPWLLKGFDFDAFTSVRRFVRIRANAYIAAGWTFAQVTAEILANLPQSVDRAAFAIDLGKRTNVVEVMELYLRECGLKVFDLAFPLPVPAPPPPPGGAGTGGGGAGTGGT